MRLREWVFLTIGIKPKPPVNPDEVDAAYRLWAEQDAKRAAMRAEQ